MSSREHEDDAVAEQLARALRADVPLRPEWREAVLRDIDALTTPSRGGTGGDLTAHIPGGTGGHLTTLDPGRTKGGLTTLRRRRWSLSPFTAIAAAILCVAIGVLGTLTLLRRPAAETTVSTVAAEDGARAGVQPTAVGSTSAGGTSVRFVIVAANATRVSLVGDFNGWNPTAMPMHRLGDGGAWVREVVLAPGRHVYAFYVDGELQVDPSAPRAAEDDFGIPSSALVVRTVSQ